MAKKKSSCACPKKPVCPCSPKKKKPSCSPKKVTTVQKARTLQGATEHTRINRNRFAIPPTAFGRVARGIIHVHGSSSNIGKISPKALEALQRFVEASMVDQLDTARAIMGEKARTLKVDHLKIANKVAHSGAGVRMESLA
jgi:histone H3/H4